MHGRDAGPAPAPRPIGLAPPPDSRPSIFYGWWIVSAVFLSQAVSVGLMAYSAGTFVKPMLAELGGGRTAGMIAITAMNATMAILSPFLGVALDRRSVRAVMCVGAVAFATGLAWLANITSAPAVFPALVLVGLGGAAMGSLGAGVLVARWFSARRGLALGISAIGTSFGGLVMSPLAAALIGSFGWRGALLLMSGAVACVLVPLLAFVIVDQPAQRGLHPDGVLAPPRRPAAGDALQLNVRQLLRDRRYWAIVMPIALTFGSFGGIMTNLVPAATDAGVPLLRASLLMSCLAGCGVAGKLGFGAIADRAPLRPALAVAITLAAIGTFLLLTADSFGALVVASCVLGLSTGGMLPVWGALIADAFGPQAFGRVMGFMNPAIFPLSLMSTLFAGAIKDATDSYDIAFGVYIGAFALAAALALGIRSRR